MAIPLMAVASLHFTMAPWFAGVQLMGRAGSCSLDQAMSAQSSNDLFYETAIEIQQASSVTVAEPDSGLTQWTTPQGQFWAPAGDSIPFLLAEQVHNFYGEGEQGVQPGDVVIDCGANVGTFVWKALQSGAKLVVAVEPSERNIESLNRNFAKEIEEGRVIVYPKGVWHEEGQLTFNTFENSALDSIVMSERVEEDRAPTTVSIDVTTIDNIVAELGLEKVDFIKMDIEGAERNALDGARQTLHVLHPRMAIAAENLPDDPEVIPALVKEIQPDYNFVCGRCKVVSLLEIAPDALYFN